jgi:hypothetical protein
VSALSCGGGLDGLIHLFTFLPPVTDIAFLLEAEHAYAFRAGLSAHINEPPYWDVKTLLKLEIMLFPL